MFVTPGSRAGRFKLPFILSQGNYSTPPGDLTVIVSGTRKITIVADATLNGGNHSGTNSGDQTTIVGITGTISQFNTACTDGDFATGGGTCSGTCTGINTGPNTGGNTGDNAGVTSVATGGLATGGTITTTGTITVTAAVQSDQETGTSNTVAVTPGTQHFHPSAAKVWGNLGVTGTANQSFGISSLTDTGTGDVQVNFSTNFSAGTYCAQGNAQRQLTNGAVASAREVSVKSGTIAVGSVSFQCWDKTTSTNLAKDPTTWHIMCFGDQ